MEFNELKRMAIEIQDNFVKKKERIISLERLF